MGQVIVGILALVAMGLVAYPLFKPNEGIDDLDGNDNETGREVEEVLLKREEVYSAIKEFDFDHQMGNLSEKDYHDLRDNYKLKAAMVLKQIDDLEPVLRQEEDEEAARPIGKAKSGASTATIARPRSATRFCTKCGTKLSNIEKLSLALLWRSSDALQRLTP